MVACVSRDRAACDRRRAIAVDPAAGAAACVSRSDILDGRVFPGGLPAFLLSEWCDTGIVQHDSGKADSRPAPRTSGCDRRLHRITIGRHARLAAAATLDQFNTAAVRLHFPIHKQNILHYKSFYPLTYGET